MADSSTGASLMTITGGHSIDALCFCLGEFKELSRVVATQRHRVTIMETGETIQMTSPDQVLVSGILQSGAVASVHAKGGTANGTRFLFEIHGTEGDLAIVPADPRQPTNIQVSEFTVRGAHAGKPLADLSIPESYRWVPPAVPTGLPFNVAQLFMRMVKAFAKESPSAQTSMRPSNATSCLTRFRRRRTPGSARFFSDDRPTVRRRCRSLGEPAVDLPGPRPGLHPRRPYVQSRP